MNRVLVSFALVQLLLSSACAAQFRTVYFEDFSRPNVLKNWNIEVKPSGWVNHELQNYTANQKNIRVENGRLILQAHKERDGKITSARVNSFTKQYWTYGKFEVRAKIPSGRGLWPAIWMLPESKSYGDRMWPDNGEIDIMESVGYLPDKIFSTLHVQKYYGGNAKYHGNTFLENLYDNFHIYSVEWSDFEMKFAVDGEVFYIFKKENKPWQEWPFDKPFYFIFNLAVGGDWGGVQGIDDSIFPALMEIDWVRVSQKY